MAAEDTDFRFEDELDYEYTDDEESSSSDTPTNDINTHLKSSNYDDDSDGDDCNQKKLRREYVQNDRIVSKSGHKPPWTTSFQIPGLLYVQRIRAYDKVFYPYRPYISKRCKKRPFVKHDQIAQELLSMTLVVTNDIANRM